MGCDKTYERINNTKARDKVLVLMEEYSVADIYREQHPDYKTSLVNEHVQTTSFYLRIYYQTYVTQI